jgi:asparagine synthase (glutamine-hydrolysing)
MNERAMNRGLFNQEFVEQLVSRHQAGENHDERLWALVNFEIWQRQFFDGESSESHDAHAELAQVVS